MEGTRARFVSAVRDLDGPELLRLLPHLSRVDLGWFRECWFSGELGELNPTNVTCAADYAGEFLNLPAVAIALHDAALDYMDRNPDSIDADTNCAAASLNLIDFLMKAGEREAAEAAAKRAARMPVKRGDQNYYLAAWLFFEFDLAKEAYPLFQRAKDAGLASVAKATGLTVADLEEMDRLLSAEVAGRGRTCRCVGCKTVFDAVKEGASADHIVMLRSGVRVPMICRSCVEELGIHREQLTEVAERIWINGEKFISNGGGAFFQWNPGF